MSELLNLIRDRAIMPSEIEELQLLAARAEASVDASFATSKYAGIRDVALEESVGFSVPFHMFAISVSLDGPTGTRGTIRDAMFCRTPEIAKFIVALLNFGGAIVAEHQLADPAP
jgi:hypothetical protein